MENHPIPQDVTGFKFKLIGSVTIKQFIYLLAAGIIAAFVVFIIPSKSAFVFFLVKIPFAFIVSSIAVGLAFVPVDGRPMDKMIYNFIRALPAENEYLYHKKGVHIAAFDFFKHPTPHAPPPKTPEKPTKQDDRRQMLHSRFKTSSYKFDQGEAAFVQNIKSFFDNPASSAPQAQLATPQKVLPQNPLDKNPSILEAHAKHAQALHDELRGLRPTSALRPVARLEPPQPQVIPQAGISRVAQQLAQQPVKSPPAIPVSQDESHVHVMKQDAQLQGGFPTLPDVANVILGIVKDPRGKVLPNILVEVVDASNIPVRAFKTNKLGQFAAATPLPNGVYKVFFEDPQKIHGFDTIEVTLRGEIFQPLEVISVDERERLRRDLFEK